MNTTVTANEAGITIDTDRNVLATALLLVCKDAGLLPPCFDPQPDLIVSEVELWENRAVVTIKRVEYVTTHLSRGDGSPAMLLHLISDTEGAFMNENGDAWPDLLADWEEVGI